MTPETNITDAIHTQSRVLLDVGNKLVAAINHNTQTSEASSRSRENWQFLNSLLLVLTMACMLLLAFCGRDVASPLTTTPGDPCAFTPCQHWHTTYIPTDAGVYPLEVYTPSLPRAWPGPPIITNPGPKGHTGPAGLTGPVIPREELLKVLETPEPGTLWVAVVGTIFILVAGLLIRREDRKIAREQKRVDERFEAALRRVEQLRDAVAQIASCSLCMETRTVARKALEEKP